MDDLNERDLMTLNPVIRRLCKLKTIIDKNKQSYIEKLERQKIVEIIEEAVEFLIQVLASKT
jgi:hypothetical protein